MNARRLNLLGEILSLPTASFREEAVVEYIRNWAADTGIAFRRDRSGNVILRGRRPWGPSKGPRWVFAAHMDHPGFVSVAQRGRIVEAQFRGHVLPEYFVGSVARFLTPAGGVRARVRSIRRPKDSPFATCRLELALVADVPPGTIGMWDKPAFALRGRRAISRACDDLGGVAAVLCAMKEVAARNIPADVTGLLTRAEEVGFVGALAACRDRVLPKGSLVVAIETSAAQPNARLGDGVVVRVGDRLRTFDPSLTAHVQSAAEELAKRDGRFRFARQLMPGGTCESTVYCAMGYQATGLCVPLGNYHNMSPAGIITAETIDLDDFDCLVKLLVALAVSGKGPADADARLKARLAKLLRQEGRLLKETGGDS